MNKTKWILVSVLLSLLFPFRVFAQQTCQQQDPCANISDLNQKTSCYSNAVDACRSQGQTLASQIDSLNNRIRLLSLQIENTKAVIQKLSGEINDLNDEITRLEGILNARSELILRRIPESYKRAAVSQFGLLFFSSNFSDFVTRLKYLVSVEQEDAALLFQVKATQNNYSARKQVREEKKQQQEAAQVELEQQNSDLSQQKQQKNDLLAVTQGSEAIYKQLYDQAVAQLTGLSNFACPQGSTSLLPNQPIICDDWGCYYNQRDSRWGGVALNNTQYSIACAGCLVTAMAMVYTHLGHKNVTPLTININPSNFASYYPAFLKMTIVADGLTTTRVASIIDSELSSGRPVIVGIKYTNGDTHFVVLISGSNGNYKMNDPFISNGHNISFADHYSLGSIFEIDKISM